MHVYWISSLRVFLTQMVLLVHSFVILTGIWPPVSAITLDSKSLKIISIVNQFNQAYYMGLFFFISGLFAVPSLDKHGRSKFIKSKLLRLGTPILIWCTIIAPALHCAVTRNFEYKLKTWEHLWFTLMLLCYEILYSVINEKIPKAETFVPFSVNKLINFLFFSWLFLSTATFLIRIYFTFDIWLPVLAQVAYLAQYLFSFVLGIYASRKNAINRIPLIFGLFCFVVGPVMFSFHVCFGEKLFGKSNGGLNTASLYLSFFEMLFFLVFSLGILVFFKFCFNVKIIKPLAKATYATYILHPIPLFLIASYLPNLWNPSNIVLIFVICLVTTLISWIIGILAIKIPYINAVI